MLAVLVCVAAAVAALAHLRVSRALVVASLRAVMQLAAISLPIIAVFWS